MRKQEILDALWTLNEQMVSPALYHFVNLKQRGIDYRDEDIKEVYLALKEKVDELAHEMAGEIK